MSLSRAARFQLTPMVARDASEEYRASTPLELFFDLVFVIAVSIAASNLHHSLSAGHVGAGLYSYLVAFFGIWWAWMNFTWFATSFGTEDWLYRVTTFVQMGGVLVYAAGIGVAFSEHSYVLLVIGYVIMRIGMVGHWVRASRHAGKLRRTTRTTSRNGSACSPSSCWARACWPPSTRSSRLSRGMGTWRSSSRCPS